MINNVLFASKVGYPISEGVESPIVIPSQESKGVSFHMSPHSNPSEPLSPVRRLSLESGPSQLDDFHVEGLTLLVKWPLFSLFWVSNVVRMTFKWAKTVLVLWIRSTLGGRTKPYLTF